MKSLLAAALLVAVTAAHAQLPAETQARVAAIAEQALRDTGVPSASIAIAVDGKPAYARAFGLARTQPPLPAEASMAYPIGSISKQFTSTAVLLLQQQGRLSIDDKVGKYFPELTRANEVSLRNLMTMTSGYEDFAPQDYSIPAWYLPEDPARTVHEWATKPLDFDPGTQWQYSNTNYVLLALIVQKVTGEPFYQLLRALVLDPAHLPGVFNAYTHRDQLQVTGYISYAMQPPRVLPLEAASWYFGDGELAMPASSLLQWDLTFMQQSILSPASYKQMETPFILPDGKDTHYGLGLHVQDRNGHLQLEHSGEVGGYVAENVVYPKDKLAVVVLTNEVASSAAESIAEQISALLLPSVETDPTLTAPDPVAAQLGEILNGLAGGHIDRSLFTANCNSYFTPQAIADFQATLAPLGRVSVVKRQRTALRGGMTFGLYRVTFARGDSLMVDTYTLPDGKIEQLLVLGKG